MLKKAARLFLLCIPLSCVFGPALQPWRTGSLQASFGMLTTIGDRTIPLQGGMEMTGGEGKAAFVLAHGQTLGYCFYRNTSMDCELAGGRSRQGLYLLRQSGAALYRSMRERGGLPSPERNEQWSTIWREHSLYGPERLGLYSDLEENTRVEIHLTEIYLP